MKQKHPDKIAIEIVRKPKWIGGSGPDCQWVAQVENPPEGRVRGTSLICAESAAGNAACKLFFGGVTNAFKKGRSIKLKSLGRHRHSGRKRYQAEVIP